MNNLFRIFDPATRFNLAINWSAVIIFSPLITSIFKSRPLRVGYGRNRLLRIIVQFSFKESKHLGMHVNFTSPYSF